MTREVRTLFLGVLTLVIYAASIFISQGSFIFPFPLNEFIFLAIAGQFLFLNWNTSRVIGILSVLAGIFGVLSTQFFWTFIYEQEEMMEFMEGLTTDYFLLAFYVLILIGGIATTVKQRSVEVLPLGIFFVLAFVAGVLMNHTVLLLVAYGIMVTSTQIRKVYAPYHLLWILLLVLKFTEWLTFILNT